ncbi:hypothetical protein PKF023_11430 [Polynucleobacter yangtzensis]|uniref:Uncharacterized protein n=1 Tax=Polynucleobacter yangtzensis TaxID=1743159 RepID=A0A9C7FAI5_9BURK|nr:hypothetical protein [Polynucleobacter yangtzensis]BDT77340.1 hypothetical protein PKF023_11430 [Polynucleobacter yangtzensis]
MADTQSNVTISQQANDALHLDLMTSLQKLSVVEQNFLIQGQNYPSFDSSFENLGCSLAFLNFDVVAWTIGGNETHKSAFYYALAMK